jgi:hypothetical protein
MTQLLTLKVGKKEILKFIYHNFMLYLHWKILKKKEFCVQNIITAIENISIY